MNKLLKYKKWLSIEEVAAYLSADSDGIVKDYDILQLAIDGSLKISVNIANYVDAKRGKIVTLENARVTKSLNGEDLILDFSLGDGKFLQLESEVIPINGILDLPMIGNEMLDVEREYQKLVSGITLESGCFEDTYVQDYENGDIYKLESIRLPTDSIFIVRTDALLAFTTATHNRDVNQKATSHSNMSDYLSYVNQASTKFWANADRDDRGTHPSNLEVEEWLINCGLSKKLAESAASIIRPKWAPTGRKPSEK